jgi:hypothetical protein
MARKTQPAAPVADVEAVKTGGLGIDEGIVLATFFILLGAVVLVVLATQGYPTMTS